MDPGQLAKKKRNAVIGFLSTAVLFLAVGFLRFPGAAVFRTIGFSLLGGSMGIYYFSAGAKIKDAALSALLGAVLLTASLEEFFALSNPDRLDAAWSFYALEALGLIIMTDGILRLLARRREHPPS